FLMFRLVDISHSNRRRSCAILGGSRSEWMSTVKFLTRPPPAHQQNLPSVPSICRHRAQGGMARPESESQSWLGETLTEMSAPGPSATSAALQKVGSYWGQSGLVMGHVEPSLDSLVQGPNACNAATIDTR